MEKKFNNNNVLYKLKDFSWTSKKHFRVIVLYYSSQNKTIYNINYIINMLDSQFVKAINYNGKVVLLINYDKNIENYISDIYSYIKNFNIFIYISNEFDDLNNISKNYIIVDNFAHYLHQNNYIKEISYCDNYIQSIFCTNEQLFDIYYNRLELYDKNNNTQLLETLYNFIICNNSLSETSRKLFIHRNTLSYRLEKIKDISQINFSNITQTINFYIYYTYHLN